MDELPTSVLHGSFNTPSTPRLPSPLHATTRHRPPPLPLPPSRIQAAETKWDKPALKIERPVPPLDSEGKPPPALPDEAGGAVGFGGGAGSMAWVEWVWLVRGWWGKYTPAGAGGSRPPKCWPCLGVWEGFRSGSITFWREPQAFDSFGQAVQPSQDGGSITQSSCRMCRFGYPQIPFCMPFWSHPCSVQLSPPGSPPVRTTPKARRNGRRGRGRTTTTAAERRRKRGSGH